MTQKRFRRLKSQKGIRKDLQYDSYQVTKRVNGKLVQKSFPTISEAIVFRDQLENNQVDIKSSSPTFKEVYEDYKINRFPELEFSTREAKEIRVRYFWKSIKDVKMNDFDPTFFHKLIESDKKLNRSNGKRQSYDKEIKALLSVFNWYKEYRDFRYHIPLNKSHKKLGVVKKKIIKNKNMNLTQTKLFFESFENEYYRDFALVQFLCCARVSEIAGMQIENIFFNEGYLVIKDVVVWNRSKVFVELKQYTKNNDAKYVKIPPQLEGILLKHINEKVSGYLFQENDEPIKYRSIQHHYNKAFSIANLPFSGTHVLRHTMGSLARQYSGNLDSVQSLMGHKSIKQTEHYAKLSYQSQGNTVESIAELLN